MENKQRHGCVTAWLIFMIIVNSLTAVLYLFMGEVISQNLPTPIPQPMMVTLAIVSIINFVLAIMLFKWKKWAFWGFVVTSLAAFAINLSVGLGIGQSLFGLAGIAILYGILQIKQKGVTTWEGLE